MAVALSLANRYAHGLALALMIPGTVFRFEAGYAAIASNEFGGSPASGVTEFHHHEM